MSSFRIAWAAVLAASAGCVGEIGGDDGSVLAPPRGTEATFGAPAIARLSRAQLVNSWRALFGAPLDVPADLPEDDQLYGFTSIAAARATIATVDAERYEAATYAVLDQVWKDDARRAAFVGCAPDKVASPCGRGFLARFGRRAWRRTLATSEIDALVTLGDAIAKDLADPMEGLRFASAAILEAPDFLFRVDVGEKDPARPDRLRYSGFEMASRLAFVLTDAPPDDGLLDAAEHGELHEPARLRAWARRLVDDDRARPALVHFFRDFMGVARLDDIDKDPKVFPFFTPTLGASMRVEIEKLFEAKVFDRGGDFRELFTTRETFVDEALARVYGLPPVLGAGFAPVTLPADGRRAGLLTTPGFLAMNAHKIATSPTRRGRFVRLGLLCEDVPPPPPGVNTTLPDDPPGQPRTLRQKLEEHKTNATCAACHERMDPIGFGLEHFDALGQWREKDDGLPVDAKTELDGAPFDGGVALGELVAKMPEVGSCIARRFYQHALGRLDGASEAPAVDALVGGFAATKFDFQELVVAMVTSDAFRFASKPSE